MFLPLYFYIQKALLMSYAITVMVQIFQHKHDFWLTKLHNRFDLTGYLFQLQVQKMMISLEPIMSLNDSFFNLKQLFSVFIVKTITSKNHKVEILTSYLTSYKIWKHWLAESHVKILNSDFTSTKGVYPLPRSFQQILVHLTGIVYIKVYIRGSVLQ